MLIADVERDEVRHDEVQTFRDWLRDYLPALAFRIDAR